MVKSIIEKLGINTPDELRLVGDVWKVYDLSGLKRPHVSNDFFFKQGNQLKKILDEKNKMLEALIDIAMCDFADKRDHKEITDVIEKSTGKTWEEIKELINE